MCKSNFEFDGYDRDGRVYRRICAGYVPSMLGLLTGSWGVLRAPSLELAFQWPEEKGQFFPVLVTQDLCGRKATQRPGEARITRRHLGQCPLQASGPLVMVGLERVDYWCINPSCLGLWGRVQTALLVFALIKRMRVNEAEL